jgi:flavin-dependent thymidylate synthase
MFKINSTAINGLHSTNGVLWDGFVECNFHKKSFKDQAIIYEDLVMQNNSVLICPPEPNVEMLACPTEADIKRILSLSAEFTAQVLHNDANNFWEKVVNGVAIPAGMEMVSYTFGIKNCSRVFTHQMVRHRLASLTQSTSRDRVLPPVFILPFDIDENIKDLNPYVEKMRGWLRNIYVDYVRMIQCGIDPQDARYLLPDSIAQSMVFQIDLKSLQNLCAQRLCLNMQPEMSFTAWRMKELVTKHSGELFGKMLRPMCDKIKRCLPIQCNVYNSCGKWPSDENSKTGKSSLSHTSNGHWLDIRKKFFKER